MGDRRRPGRPGGGSRGAGSRGWRSRRRRSAGGGLSEADRHEPTRARGDRPIDAATPTPACPADPDFSGPGGNAPDADSRAGSDRAGGNPRRCAVTRRTGPREGLIRFVVAPDGTLTPDLAETLPGRGVWIAAARDALAAPGLAKAAARSVRKRVSVPDGLADTVERLLAERCRATLGLARRAGLVDAGFDKVRAAIAAGAPSSSTRVPVTVSAG
ncbi:MAG: DUF448 domain-containing protein, partial [Rhodospirillaceae bacterium]|nr:DUF448 domain-containing protein [Rhodospirillaceae bacterium]